MNRWKIGSLLIERLVESENADIDPAYFFPETALKDWAPHRELLQPHAMVPETGRLIFPIQSYLVRTGRHNILIDTGVGDNKQRERPHWHMCTDQVLIKHLAEAGIQPAEIDFVIHTHLHADHIGWDAQMSGGKWLPTFPNASYIIVKKEWEHWRKVHKETPLEHIADSIQPVVDAGLVELVDYGFSLDDGLWLESTPGHSPHHVSIVLKSDGQQAVIAGDVMHTPAQCAEPLWAVRPDFDREQARKTRRTFLERYSDTDALVCMTHFASPSVGRIVRHAGAFLFKFDTGDG
jgi:glyoxylase-like metal-dependent hydrolase (beta-lactamase superfamily II)